MKPTDITGYPFSNGDKFTAVSLNQICKALDGIVDYSGAIEQLEEKVSENTEDITIVTENIGTITTNLTLKDGQMVKVADKTKQEYADLPVKDKNTLFIVADSGDTEGEIYFGDVALGGGGGSQPTNETVQIAFTTSSGTVDWTQYTVGVQVQGQAVQQKAIDASGNCEFMVTLGSTYKIIYPKIYNYAYIDDATYIAVLSLRVLNIQYQSLDGHIRSVVLERGNPADWATSGNEGAVDTLLSLGTYVIDDVHKKYAKLSPLDHSQFVDGTAWSGTYGDAFRHIPEVFYKMTTNESTEPVLQISAYNLGEGAHSWGDSWIGTYKGSVQGGVLVSRPNVTTTQKMTMSAFFNAAQQHTEGADYGLVNYFDQCKLLALMYAKYGNANSETIMGAGLQNAGTEYYTHTTGTTAALGDATGQMQYLTTQYYMCKLFGIEDLAGSTWEFRSNIRFTSSQCIVYEGNVVSNDAQGRTFARTLNNASSAYITKMELGEYCDFIPKAVGGSSGNYYCDGTWTSTSGQLLLVGGAANSGVVCGCSAARSHNAFDIDGPSSGSRLAFRGDISEYELVDGATLAALNA